MIPDESTIDQDLEAIKKMASEYTQKYAGHLTDSAETLCSAFKDNDEIWRKLEKIFVYARMRRDEDNANDKYQAMADKSHAVIAAVSAALSFFTPEMLASSEEKLLSFIEENDEL